MISQNTLIIGGGIAGPAMALFLRKAGFNPIIYEAHSYRSDIGGGLQIAPNGMSVLRELKLSRQLLRLGMDSAEFRFENQFGKTLACIPNGPATVYDDPAVQIRRSVLHRSLLDELERLRIPIVYGKRLRSIVSARDGVIASFVDGEVAQGDILVGADGIHSQTRKILFPEFPAPFYAGLITVGGFAEHAALRPKDAKGLTRTHLIFGLNGFFGYGYYDRANPCAVMWWSHLRRSEEPSSAELHSADTDELRRSIALLHRGWSEPVEIILHNINGLVWGPVHDIADLPAWYKHRVVLIGDAAHAISPHAGQGASLALEDSIELARDLRDGEYQDAFQKYQRDRQSRVATIAAEARKRGDAKRTLTPSAARMRDVMLSLFLRVRGKHLFDKAYRYEATWS